MSANQFYRETIGDNEPTKELVVMALKQYGAIHAKTGYIAGMADFSDMDRNFDPSEQDKGVEEYSNEYIKNLDL